jgi:hypothetical protein
VRRRPIAIGIKRGVKRKALSVAHWHNSLGDDVMVFSAPISDIPTVFTSLKVVVFMPLLRRHLVNVAEQPGIRSRGSQRKLNKAYNE